MDELINNLEIIKAAIEWELPIDYAATIDEVIKILKAIKEDR